MHCKMPQSGNANSNASISPALPLSISGWRHERLDSAAGRGDFSPEMGARSGNNYLTALRKLKAEVWIGGARVADPTVHPAFVNGARSLASLYDMQIEHPERMTYRVEDGGRAGLSFIQPQNVDDVRKRSAMFRRWAEYSGGMIGRTPDYLNASLAAMAAALEIFRRQRPALRRQYRHVLP